MDGQNSEMQNQMMGYDRAATMFSPEGHILQVEYAEKTVRLGSASIGIACTDGVMMLADKRITDTLIAPESANKITEIDNNIIGTAAGILSDARVLLGQAQLLAQQHRVTYDSAIDVLSVIKALSDIKQQYTQHPGVRPFGISLMVAGIDVKNRLYVSDITGNFFEFYATAIGENDEAIKELLRKKYTKDIKVEEAMKLALNIFKEIKEKSFNVDSFDAAYIMKGDKDMKVHRINGDKLKKYIK